ncbi:MAG: hypothetical protein IJF61_05935 [Clostridia bacterium]|nr:hypothetical protein [Clostridia bacterium]
MSEDSLGGAMMVKKRILRIGVLLLSLILLMSLYTSVFASPEVLPETVTSTAEGYVTLLAPEQLTSSTTNKSLPIAASAPEGTVVTVYRYSYTAGNYQKVVVGEVPLESVVGSTTLFAGRTDLTPGLNKFLIRGAKDDETYTVIPFEVNVLNEGFMDRIKGVINIILAK